MNATPQNSPILDLQRQALDDNVSVTSLLRTARLIARKLGLEDEVSWIQNELNGYSREKEVPEYRRIRGILKARNPYKGWIGISIDDPKSREEFSSRALSQSVSELEEMSTHDNNLEIPSNELSPLIDRNLPVSLFFPPSKLKGVLEVLRNKILDWSMDLEKAGILGDGLVFSPEEKATTKSQDFTVTISGVSNSNILVGTDGAVEIGPISVDTPQDEIIATLVQKVKTLRSLVEQSTTADERDVTQAKTALAIVEAELSTTAPRKERLGDGLKLFTTIASSITGVANAVKTIAEIVAVLP